ncbi:MAG: hypothetical protein J6S69_03665 [Proteobacteria bacterium]|nr:hypothetical protein [Pseudomonadota bacterium]
MKSMNCILWIIFTCIFCCISCEFKTSEKQYDLETTANHEAQKRTADMLNNMNKANQAQRDEARQIMKDANP